MANAEVIDRNEGAGIPATDDQATVKKENPVKAWMKRNKKKATAIILAGVLVFVGVVAGISAAGILDKKKRAAESDASQKQTTIDEQDKQIDQITGERDDLQKEVDNLKDNREFNPTEENIQTINGYKGILGGKITDLAQFDYNKSSKEVTLWFNATKNGENIMFAYTMKADFKGDSCTTQDVMDLLEAKAESRELDVALYDDIEVVAQSAGAEAKAVASAIRAKVGGKGTATLTHEETGTEMEVETTERVYMSKKVTRDKAGRETVEITLATRDEDGKLKTQKVSTLAGEVYSNGDILNHIAKETGAEVKTQEVEAE